MKNHAKRAIGHTLLIGMLSTVSVPLVRADYVTDPMVESTVRGDQSYAFPAGYVRVNQPFAGAVHQVTGDNQITGNRMISGGTHWFYLRMNPSEDAKVGSLYTVYRRFHKVYHPITRQYLGELIHQLGVVRIIQIEGRLAAAKLVASTNPIGPGDHLMPFTPPEAEAAAQSVAAPAAGVEGVVVDFLANRTLVGQRQVVYIDRGRQAGVKVGDLMTIYRAGGGLPRRTLGEMKVLAIEDQTATALVTKSLAPVLVGDRVSLQVPGAAQAQAQAQADALPPTEKEQVRRLAQRIDDLAKESSSPAGGRSNAVGQQVVVNLDELVDHLYFDSGDASLKGDGQVFLKQIGALLKDMPDKPIRIEGHADAQEIGPSLKTKFPSNYDLSRARAAGVARFLVQEAGLDPDRVSTVGYGASKPVGSNITEEGRKKNRRVEIVFPADPSSKSEPKSETRPDAKVESPDAPPAVSADAKPAVYTEQSLPNRAPADANATTLSTVATPSLSDTGGSSLSTVGAGNVDGGAPANDIPAMNGAGGQAGSPTSDAPAGDAKTSALPAGTDGPVVDKGAF